MTYSYIINDNDERDYRLIENHPHHKVCNGEVLLYWDYPTELFEWACDKAGFDPNDAIYEFPDGSTWTYLDALNETEAMIG